MASGAVGAFGQIGERTIAATDLKRGDGRPGDQSSRYTSSADRGAPTEATSAPKGNASVAGCGRHTNLRLDGNLAGPVQREDDE